LPNGLHTDHLYVTTLPGAALLWPERRSFRAGKLMTERKRGRQREASGVRFNGRTLNDLLPQRPLLPLRSHAERALSDYFTSLNGSRPADLYDLVLREVEEPLFRVV